MSSLDPYDHLHLFEDLYYKYNVHEIKIKNIIYFRTHKGYFYHKSLPFKIGVELRSTGYPSPEEELEVEMKLLVEASKQVVLKSKELSKTATYENGNTKYYPEWNQNKQKWLVLDSYCTERYE